MNWASGCSSHIPCRTAHGQADRIGPPAPPQTGPARILHKLNNLILLNQYSVLITNLLDLIDGNIAFIRFHTSFPLILIFLAVSGSKKGAARRVYHTLRAAPLLFTRIIIPQCPAAFKPAAHFIRIVHLPEKSI